MANRGWSGADDTGSNLEVGVGIHEPRRQRAQTITARAFDQQRNVGADPAPVIAVVDLFDDLMDAERCGAIGYSLLQS